MLYDTQVFPEWLVALLSEKFFNACLVHEEDRRNEKNIFCFDCCEAICPNCLLCHRLHRLLQVRRYVYRNVLRIKDAQKLMDCVSVQTYISNGDKVVFLNQRPSTRPTRSSAKICRICNRAVHNSFQFCSIYCKFQHMVKTGENLSDHLCNWESLSLTLPDDHMTPESVLEPSNSGSSDSASSSGGGGGVDLTLACSVSTEIVRKKRSSGHLRSDSRPPEEDPAAVHGGEGRRKNRRKGTPQQAPFY